MGLPVVLLAALSYGGTEITEVTEITEMMCFTGQ